MDLALHFIDNLIFVVFCLLIFGTAGALIAEGRGGNPVAYFFLCCVIGPLGILIALTTGIRCSRCMRRIHVEAAVCPYCQNDRKEVTAINKAQTVESPETGPQRRRSNATETERPPPVPRKAVDSETKGWMLAGLVGLFLVILFVLFS